MALTPVPVIDPALPAAPNPSDAEAVFDPEAFAFTSGMAGFGDDVKAIGDATYANALWAETKASESSTSANTATTQADISVTQAGIATTQAGLATTARIAAEAALDAFDDKYLGSKTSDPTLDNDGNPLQEGSFYINSTSGAIRVYTSGNWVQGIAGVAGVSSFNGAIGNIVGVNSVDGMTGVVTLKTIGGIALTGVGDITTPVTVTSGVVTAPHTLVDTRTGAVTLTLSANPIDKDNHSFQDAAGTFAVNNFTLGRNGKSFKDVFGNIFAEDLVFDVSNTAVMVFYDGTHWRFQ